MKQDNSDSNLPEIEAADQQRNKAVEKFINPVKTSRLKRNWLKIGLWAGGSVIVVCGLVAVIVYETSKPPKSVVVPSTFDVSAMKSVIGANDSEQMTFDEYTVTAPSIWVGQNKTMTVPVPILFKDNRIPNLSVEKSSNGLNELLNVITINGLEQGDVIVSPVDGEIQITPDDNNLNFFSLYTTDSQGNEETVLMFSVPGGLSPLIDFDTPTDKPIEIPIKKDQPIGNIITPNTSLTISGGGGETKDFNLATTSGGKVILLTK